MNRFGSHRIYENRPLYQGPPPQYLSEAWRAVSFLFNFSSPIRRSGAPSGAVAIIVYDGERGNNHHSYVITTIQKKDEKSS
jgi:hypothetical protein